MRCDAMLCANDGSAAGKGREAKKKAAGSVRLPASTTITNTLNFPSTLASMKAKIPICSHEIPKLRFCELTGALLAGSQDTTKHYEYDANDSHWTHSSILPSSRAILVPSFPSFSSPHICRFPHSRTLARWSHSGLDLASP